MNLDSLLELALEAGEKASKAILIAKKSLKVWKKEDGTSLSSADVDSNNILNEILGKSDIPICSEEKSIPYEKRRSMPVFWLIDPLDGTSGFINGSKEYCILIALIAEQRPILSLIYEPEKANVYYAHTQSKVYKNNSLLEIDTETYLKNKDIALFSVNHQDSKEKKIESSFSKTFHIGSALKFCALLEGKAGIYYRCKGLKSWDIAAGDFLINKNGGSMLDISKNFILYNQKEFTCPSFIACAKKEFIRDLDIFYQT